MALFSLWALADAWLTGSLSKRGGLPGEVGSEGGPVRPLATVSECKQQWLGLNLSFLPVRSLGGRFLLTVE